MARLKAHPPLEVLPESLILECRRAFEDELIAKYKTPGKLRQRSGPLKYFDYLIIYNRSRRYADVLAVKEDRMDNIINYVRTAHSRVLMYKKQKECNICQGT